MTAVRFSPRATERDATVGRLTYGSSGHSIEVEDRALAHLQIVMGAKLRRNESHFFSWRDGTDAGGGRGSIWIDSSIEMHFSYDSVSRPVINRRWLEQLALSANTPQGLQLTDEPATEPEAIPGGNARPVSESTAEELASVPK